MSDNNIALMAHLMRRAGFGAGREELERCLERGYESTVEELLDTSGRQQYARRPDSALPRGAVRNSAT